MDIDSVSISESMTHRDRICGKAGRSTPVYGVGWKRAGTGRGRMEFMDMEKADERRCSPDTWKGVLLSAERGNKGGAKKSV